MGNGSPGLFGADWDGFSRTYSIQLVHAPKSAPYPNGLTERVVPPLNEALNAILTEVGDRPPHRIPTQAVMARNHVPRTVTGISPAMAMAGRCDRLDGHAAAAWSHNPDTVDPAAHQANDMRNILIARPAVMKEDADRALTACLRRYLPDRSREFPPLPIADSSQIAQRGKWVGAYRVISHEPSNRILELGR